MPHRRCTRNSDSSRCAGLWALPATTAATGFSYSTCRSAPAPDGDTALPRPVRLQLTANFSARNPCRAQARSYPRMLRLLAENSMQLDQVKAVITGGASGLGHAVAQYLAAQGGK